MPVWVIPDEEQAIDALPFCNLTSTDCLLTKFKDVNFDIESFISERVCEFADPHKAAVAEPSEASELVPKQTYYCERLGEPLLVSEKLRKTSATGQAVYRCRLLQDGVDSGKEVDLEGSELSSSLPVVVQVTD